MAMLKNQSVFFFLIVGLLALCISNTGYARDSRDAPVIVITPTRTVQTENTSSSTVYILNSNEIANSGAKTTTELLRGIPGIQIDDLFGNGVEVSVSVRGFSSTANANTLILVNGRRLNHSDTAAPDLHHIFPKDIEQIEVLVGSAGTLYGDQAVGGVINIITKKTLESYMEAGLKLGSFNYKSVQFLTSQQFNSQWGYRLSAEKFQSDHYRDHNKEDNSNIYGLIEYQTDGQSVFLEVQKIEDELELPGALLENEFDDDPTQINAGFINDFINEDTDVASIGYKLDIGHQLFSIDFTQRTTDADVRQSFRNSPSPSAGAISRENRSLNPKISGTLITESLPYLAGIDIEETDYDLSLPNVFGTTTASNQQETESLFFQLNPKLSEQIQLTFGMRKSEVENNMKDGFSFPTGQKIKDDISVKELGLVYKMQQNLKFSFRFDENFRFAKVNEFALALTGETLKSQTGESFEIGMDWKLDNHRITSSIYQLDLENEIVFDPTVGPDFGFGPIGANVNLDKTRREGLTFLLSSKVSSNLSIKTEIGVVDAKYKSGVFNGNKISGVADRILKIRGDLKINNEISTYLETQYTSDHFAQGDNANAFGKVDSITVINAGLAYHYKSLNLSFRVNNLADKKYAEFITNNGFGAAFQPSPERNYLLSASYRFE